MLRRIAYLSACLAVAALALLFTALNPQQFDIDVGITRTDAGLVGDVDPGVAELAAYLTPVPGGVGPMTVAMLIANAVAAAGRGLQGEPALSR